MIINREKTLNFFYGIIDNKNQNISYINNLLSIYPNVLEYMINNKTPDLSKVQYVKNKRYNYLKNKVNNNYHLLNLNDMLKDCFDFSILKKLFDFYLSKQTVKISNNNKKYVYENINKHIKDNIIENPYHTLCKLNGIGFIRADKILLKANSSKYKIWNYDLKTSVFRCNSFILFYLINCLNGSTYTTIDNLKYQMMNKYGLIECLDSFNNALIDNRIKIIGNKIMLTSTFLEEQNISKFIKQCLDTKIQKNYHIDINKYSNLNNFKLTEKQLKTLKLLNLNQLVLLNGFAGTGKSSSIKALINMLEDNNLSFRLLAPTGKAAKTISGYTEREANTIHYLLSSEFPEFNKHLNEDNEYNNISNLNFYKRTENYKKHYIDYDVLIIDESSMLSISLFNMLIKYINPNRSKLLLIGDSFQLPSIQYGNLYQDLLSIDDIPKISLDEIFRYTENGLINVATNIRLGNKYLDNLKENEIKEIGNSYSFQQTEDNSNLLNLVLNKYIELINLDGLNGTCILTAKNIGQTGTYVINNLIQQIINKESDLKSIGINVDGINIKFKVNDIVMNVKNNYNAIPEGKDDSILLANGQIGIVKHVNIFDNSLIITIEDEDYKFDYDAVHNLRLAYCFTIHKAQGSQFKNIIYISPKSDIFMTNANLLYVGITRAQDKCYHFGSYKTINSKINVRENLKRNTTLVLQYQNLL